jgi:hypothetical protein
MSASPEDRLRAAGVRRVVHLSVVRPEPPPREDAPDWALVEPEPDVPEPEPTPGDAKSALWVAKGAWDMAATPLRPWLAPGYLLRGSVSILGGAGGGGKSSIVVCWTIAAALGREVGDFHPKAPMVIVNYNVEDDEDEQQRRYSAALVSDGLTPHDIADKVIRCGPHDVGTLFERDPSTGRILPTTAMHTLEQVLVETRADALFCDPLAELHNAEENDNTAMRSVVAAFRGLAKRLNIAVMLLHHDRKGMSTPGDMDRMRGASAVSGAVRVGLTLSTMSQEEAEKFGIPSEQRRQHFRIDGAKSNYAPTQDAEWWRLDGVKTPSGEMVAACRPWTPPSTFGDQSMDDCVAILEALDRGTSDGVPWAARSQAGKDWAGQVLMRKGATKKQAEARLAAWVEAGTITEEETPRANSKHKRQGYTVNMLAVAEMRQQARKSANG